MNKTPDEVKAFVAKYFKTQKLTQKDAGQMIGFSRQAISNLLGNQGQFNGYFTEKQAILFSLAFGFNKEFLLCGQGEPLTYWKDQPSSRSAFDFIKGYVGNKIRFCKEIQSNTALLGYLGGDVNQDVLNGMLKAFEDVLGFIDSEFK